MIWGDAAALGEIVTTAGSDPGIDRLLVLYDQPSGLTGASEESWRAVREAVIAGAALSPVATLVSSTLPELLDDGAAWEFAQAGVAAAAGLRTGLRCAAARLRPPGDAGRLREIGALARALEGGASQAGEWLAEDEAKALLRAEGLSVPDGRTVADEDDAVAVLGALGGHVALKLSAATVQHKSELDGVVLHLRSEPELRLAYRRLAALAGRYDGKILAERMAPPGLELLVAARTDGIVPTLVLGLGGIWTELLDDVVIVPLPADAGRIEHALRSLRGAPLLLGGRGGTPLDFGAAARLAEGIARMLVERSLALVECNPVLVGPEGQGAVAVDAAVRRRG